MKKDSLTKYMFQAQGALPAFKPLTGPELEKSSLLGRVFSGGAPTLSDFLNAAFETAIMIGALLAVLRLIYAGILYMTTDVFDKKKQAITIIQDTVLGLLLLLAIYLILSKINPDIVLLKTDVLPAATSR